MSFFFLSFLRAHVMKKVGLRLLAFCSAGSLTNKGRGVTGSDHHIFTHLIQTVSLPEHLASVQREHLDVPFLPESIKLKNKQTIKTRRNPSQTPHSSAGGDGQSCLVPRKQSRSSSSSSEQECLRVSLVVSSICRPATLLTQLFLFETQDTRPDRKSVV